MSPPDAGAFPTRGTYLLCDKCGTVLTDAAVNTPEPVACPDCHAPLLARVFPAFFRAQAGVRAAESVVSDEDAGCFYHPRKKAVVPCQQCGRFLCALCDLKLDGRHLCPGCVEAGRAANGALALQNGLLLQPRILHDKLALGLATVPLIPIFLGFTLFTAPVALFLVVRYWNEPRRRPVPSGRGRLILAGLLALGQLAAWGCLFYYRLFLMAA